MMWNHDAWGGGDWLAMLLLMMFVLVALGAVVVLLVRGRPVDTAPPRHDAGGEAGDDDYERALLPGAGRR